MSVNRHIAGNYDTSKPAFSFVCGQKQGTCYHGTAFEKALYHSKRKIKIIMTHVKFTRKPFEGTFNNFVDDLFVDLPVLYKNEQNWKGTIPVNIKETDKNYSIEIVAPGFEKTDFKINLEQQLLTISAEKKNEIKAENEKQIRNEYSYRSFKRSFTLDEKMDGTHIDAKYVNGVLTLNLPKKEEVKPAIKEINVH